MNSDRGPLVSRSHEWYLHGFALRQTVVLRGFTQTEAEGSNSAMNAVFLVGGGLRSSGSQSDASCPKCKELLFREVLSFYQVVFEEFGRVQAERGLEDWFELFENVCSHRRHAASAARRATIYSLDRLASRYAAKDFLTLLSNEEQLEGCNATGYK